MVHLDAQITTAIDSALKYSDPRFEYHLHTRGLAALLKAASPELLYDYHSAGKLALEQFILGYFIQSEIHWACRGTIRGRILSLKTFEYFVSTTWPERDAIDSTDLASDMVYIFVGAMIALRYDAPQWFKEAFGPMIDAAAAAVQTHSRDRLAEEKSNSPNSPNADTPTAKRSRLNNAERKIFHIANAADVLSAPSPLNSALDEPYLEEIEVVMMLNPASLVERPAPPPIAVSPCAVSSDMASSLFNTATWSSLLSAALETTCKFFTGVGAFTRRQFATFKESASGGDEIVLRIPGAYNEDVIDVIKPGTANDYILPVLPPSSATRPSPPFRRSRAPSLPSPLGFLPQSSRSIAFKAVASKTLSRPYKIHYRQGGFA